MTIKDKIKKIIEVVSADQQKLLDNLTEQEKEEIGSVKRWSFKNVLIHSTFWWNIFLENLQDSADGKEIKKTPEDINQINDQLLEKHCHDSWESVLKENTQVRENILKWLESFSEDELMDTELYEWTHGRALYHQFLGDCWHDEWHFSRYLAEHDRLDEGVALQENLVAQLKILPEWEYIAVYNLACFYSVSGMKPEAITTLKKALKMRPDMKEWSKEDPDFENIRNEPEYKKIYED
ncbi:MAG: Rhodanese domain protein [Anaerolinea thermophila]|uniref:Rhodanese domain protein n=1 Tax=Anaerolinea thermophila TaxID=167964 RepID=A0A117LH22_9CHLR|nr:MAG: Rhodanese domain protein [Anaerolinea thermophila]